MIWVALRQFGRLTASKLMASVVVVAGERVKIIPSDFKTESKNEKKLQTGCGVKPGMTE
jgi:hypothetical protein